MTPAMWAQVKHFKPSEFDSYTDDGKGKVAGTHKFMDARVVLGAEAIRVKRGKPIGINSAYRTPSRNKIVKGAPKSSHMEGLALDISTKGWTERERIDLILFAKEQGFTGIGIAKTFIHIDMKNRTASWIYPVGGGQKAIPVGQESRYV